MIVAGKSILLLGKQGENNKTEIIFPIKDWVEECGTGGVFSLVHKRSGDKDAYPVPIVADGENVYWTVRNVDVASPGYGFCELSYIVGDLIAKSATWATRTLDSVSSVGDPPDPYESWLDTLAKVAARAENSAENAGQSAENAENSAEKAEYYAKQADKSREDAFASASSAQAAANSMSFVSFSMSENGELVLNRSELLGTTNFHINKQGELEVEI